MVGGGNPTSSRASSPLTMSVVARLHTAHVCNDGKITKILHASCTSVKVIKKRGGEFANILMLRANNWFWVDVFKHFFFFYKCVPASFNDFAAEPLHYNMNICRDRNVIYIRKWIENGIVSVGNLLGPKGYLSCDQFKMRYPLFVCFIA